MAIDINELNEWLKTDEGKQWGEQFKTPLLSKRDELLAELKLAGGRLSELELRSRQTEGILSEERAALSAVLVDQGLAGLLREKRIYESVIPSVVARLKETYGITVKANGLNRAAYGIVKGENGKESELSIADIVSMWSKTPEAMEVTPNGNAGGGVIPGSLSYASTSSSSSLKSLSGTALAQMSDKEFRNACNHALNSAKENNSA